MSQGITEALRNLFKLFRFLFWYGAGVALLLYGLPAAAGYLQDGYESLNGSVKLLALAGFLAVVATWHVLGRRDRLRAELGAAARESG